ncbi:MAG: 1-deoxy-D-xylulose-5-phosphate reductoisomerase [Thermodesulfobacteriota bacterium]
MKSLSLLGSTGSIGVQVLKLISRFENRFRIVGLSAGKNIPLLKEQVLHFRPRMVSVASEKEAQTIRAGGFPGYPLKILWGEQGHEEVASLDEADMVVSAMVGAVGLRPTLAAIRSGKTVALANKEPLVMAGALIMQEVRKNKVVLLPVDSEHSAIFQVLQGQQRTALKRIILTASGGPFRDYPREEMARITGGQALNHPRWKMGPKISIDSATLMNKGLEVMEAGWLFGVPLDQIDIYIHPQSIVHSMVEFQDGSVLAQLGNPDMMLPIAYALSYPERLPLVQPPLDLTALEGLTFSRPDLERFPCLKLALVAGKEGGTLPAVLNAANEAAVAAFLAGGLTFQGIAQVIEATMEKHHPFTPSALDEILEVDAWARAQAGAWISERKGFRLKAEG